MTRQLDPSGWPLVVLKPSPFGTTGSLRVLSEGMVQLLDRGERFCILADFTDKTCMELDEVRCLGDLHRTHGARMDELVVAQGLAVPSAMVRGALKLVFRARPPRYPYVVFRQRRRARAYLESYLAELPRMSVAVGH